MYLIDLIHIQLIMFYNIVFQMIFGKTDTYSIFSKIQKYFNVKFSGEYDKVDKNVHVYLCNHVSWADFFIDNCCTGSNNCYISRMMVFFAVPFTSIYGILNNIIYFFYKNKNSRIHFGKYLKDILENKKSIILYPEGTRNINMENLPLRKKGLETIYEMKLTTQIININNKNKVVNELMWYINKNVICNVMVSERIEPEKFNSFDEYFQYIQMTWNKLYKDNKSNFGNVIDVPVRIDKPNVDLSKIYLLLLIFCHSIFAYNFLNLFVVYIHCIYFGMIYYRKYIGTLDKERISVFIYSYNWFQVLLSLYMTFYGLTIFDIKNPLLLGEFSESVYIRRFLLIHAFSKIVDFIDTMILIVTNKNVSFLHVYHHSTIGLIWFYMSNKNINSVYFGALLNSIVHSIMYFYFNYSHQLKSIKSWVTKIQLTQFIILICHPIIFIILNNVHPENNIYAYVQLLYQITMVILFSNFYYKNYIEHQKNHQS